MANPPSPSGAAKPKKDEPKKPEEEQPTRYTLTPSGRRKPVK